MITPAQQISAPVAQPLPKRTDLDLQADIAWHYARFALTPEMREHWERRLRALEAQRLAA